MGNGGGPIRTDMPMPTCAADREESAAGITSSKSPNARNRITRCSFILFSSCPLGLPWEYSSTRRANLPQMLAQNESATAVCPDEWLIYLNTPDWIMLLGEKLAEMRSFQRCDKATRAQPSCIVCLEFVPD